MYRLAKLEKEINKNIKIDERSNVQIHGWSPNNVRRLFITKHYGIIQYHKTGGKYNKIIDVVDLKKEYEQDLSLLQSNKYKKSILGVLTSGRICSMIEEIYFVYDGYNISLLEKDMDLTIMGKGKQAIENRFVRLYVIGVLSNNMFIGKDYLDKSKEGGLLLYDFIKDGLLKEARFNEDTWWKGSYLRPKFYTFDKDVLEEHFNKIKERKELELKEKELLEIEKKKLNDLVNSKIDVINKLLYKVEFIKDSLNSIFQNAGVLDKGEWALYGKIETVNEILSRSLKEKWLQQNYKGIDIEKLKQIMDADIVEKVKMHIELVLNEKMYVQDAKKLSLKDSITSVEKLLKDLLTVLSCVVYGVLAKYLVRNTLKYSDFYYKKLGIMGLTYTMLQAEFVNNYFKVDDSGSLFRGVGIQLVDVSSYKVTDVDKILNGLQKVITE